MKLFGGSKPQYPKKEECCKQSRIIILVCVSGRGAKHDNLVRNRATFRLPLPADLSVLATRHHARLGRLAKMHADKPSENVESGSSASSQASVPPFVTRVAWCHCDRLVRGHEVLNLKTTRAKCIIYRRAVMLKFKCRRIHSSIWNLNFMMPLAGYCAHLNDLFYLAFLDVRGFCISLTQTSISL